MKIYYKISFKMCITFLIISTDETEVSIFNTMHNYLFYSYSKNELASTLYNYNETMFIEACY